MSKNRPVQVLQIICRESMFVLAVETFLFPQHQKMKTIIACCTTLTGSDYGLPSAARGVVALSACNNRQPTQAASRWAGLPSLISFPPSAAEKLLFFLHLRLCAFVKWSVMIKCDENFSDGGKWSPLVLLYLLNLLTFICAERWMDAPYGSALSFLMVL